MRNPTHHVITDPGEDYVCFVVSCDTCGIVLFEFVHRQRLDQDALTVALRHYSEYGPPMSAESWMKPQVRVVCENRSHQITPVKDGENRNMCVTHRVMRETDFKKWYESQQPFEGIPEEKESHA